MFVKGRMIFLSALLIGTVCMQHAVSLYSPASDVIQLTDSNFNSKVIDSINVWIVEYFAPWCGHCKNFAPEYSKAATALKGIVRVGAIDCDQYRESPACSGITGFPTIKIFTDKRNPKRFDGPRTARGIADGAIDAIKNVVSTTLGGGGSSSGSNDERKRSSGDSKDVIQLTDSNFDSLVLESEDIWLVEFYAPWCGHCKNFAPEWASAAEQLKGKVKLGAIDATIHQAKGTEYSIRGYPTIKYFPAGKKSSSDATEFDGGRTASDVVTWALDKYHENLPAPDVKQVTDGNLFKGACELKQLCVISFLPHILDCQSECRNRYLSILKDVAIKYKRKDWGWIWSEAGTQPDLESALEIGGFGYPAMALLNQRKMKYSVLKGSFSENGINEFLKELLYARGTTATVKGAALPNVISVEPWDGKDGELPSEEDIDLSDIDLGESESDTLQKDEL